ncbi:MAG: RNA polymerase sigma factor [Saprospiraceae bacterium]
MNKQINIKLIAACVSNDRNAQKQLYDILLPYLNVICQRYLNNQSERSDVLQETFISLFKNLNQFDIAKASFKTWATRIAINYCLKNNEKRSRLATQELVVNLHEPKVNPEGLSNLTNEELLTWVKKMPNNYFTVFNLFVVDGFSHKEIADILKIEESLSRQRLSRSKTWLKDKLPDDFRSMFSLA